MKQSKTFINSIDLILEGYDAIYTILFQYHHLLETEKPLWHKNRSLSVIKILGLLPNSVEMINWNDIDGKSLQLIMTKNLTSFLRLFTFLEENMLEKYRYNQQAY